MSDPSDARQALIVEAIGELAGLLDSMERLSPAMREVVAEIARARASLGDALLGFGTQMAAITENAKTVAVRHVAAHTEQAARRSIDQQRQAMAEAASAAFAKELAPTLQRVERSLQPLIHRQRRWESWLTHAAVAAVTMTATLIVTVWFLPR